MKIYTIVQNSNFKTIDNVYLSQCEYSLEQYKSFVEEAKKYYLYTRVVSDETDMNDNYHSDHSYLTRIYQNNIVIKDNKFFGVVAHGLGRYSSFKAIVSLEKEEISKNEEEGYNSTSRMFKLCKYDYNDEILNYPYEHCIKVESFVREDSEGKEIVKKESERIISLDCSYLVIKNDKVVGVKLNDIDFTFDSKNFTYTLNGGRKYFYVYTLTKNDLY